MDSHTPLEAPQVVQEILKCKWAVLIIEAINDGQVRPSGIERTVQGISHKVLHQRLAKMTRLRMLERVERGKRAQQVEYHLTNFGVAIGKVIADIRRIRPPDERLS